MYGVFKNMTPNPHTDRRVCTGGRTYSLGGEGVGGSKVRKTPDTALYSINVSTLWPYSFFLEWEKWEPWDWLLYPVPIYVMFQTLRKYLEQVSRSLLRALRRQPERRFYYRRVLKTVFCQRNFDETNEHGGAASTNSQSVSCMGW